MMEEDDGVKSSQKFTRQEFLTPKPTYVVSSESRLTEKKNKKLKKAFPSSFSTISQPKNQAMGISHT